MSPVAKHISTNEFMPKRLVPITSIRLPINQANVIAGTIYMPKMKFEHPECFGKNCTFRLRGHVVLPMATATLEGINGLHQRSDPRILRMLKDEPMKNATVANSRAPVGRPSW